MRVGLMVGTDSERSLSERLPEIVSDVQAAETAGFASFWIPQVPGYLDPLTVIALAGSVTSTIEIGTAIVPIQTRHPMAMADLAARAIGIGADADTWLASRQRTQAFLASITAQLA